MSTTIAPVPMHDDEVLPVTATGDSSYHDDDVNNDMLDIEPEPFDWSACNDDGFFTSNSNNNNNNAIQTTPAPQHECLLQQQQQLDDSTANHSLDISNISVVSNEDEERHHVSFGQAHVRIVESYACQDEDARQAYWYQSCEIDVFRTTARELCRRLRNTTTTDVPEEPRGLELRTSLNRQWRKQLARTCILKAQRKCPEQLAQVAARCTQLPRQEALDQATRDFCAVYYPGWAAFLPETVEHKTCQEVIAETQQVLSEKRRRRQAQQERPLSPSMLSTVSCPGWQPEAASSIVDDITLADDDDDDDDDEPLALSEGQGLFIKRRRCSM